MFVMCVFFFCVFCVPCVCCALGVICLFIVAHFCDFGGLEGPLRRLLTAISAQSGSGKPWIRTSMMAAKWVPKGGPSCFLLYVSFVTFRFVIVVLNDFIIFPNTLSISAAPFCTNGRVSSYVSTLLY